MGGISLEIFVIPTDLQWTWRRRAQQDLISSLLGTSKIFLIPSMHFSSTAMVSFHNPSYFLNHFYWCYRRFKAYDFYFFIFSVLWIWISVFYTSGVIWKGDKLIDGVPETLDFLRSNVSPFSFALPVIFNFTSSFCFFEWWVKIIVFVQ